MTAWVVSPERRASFSSSALMVDGNFMLVAVVAMTRLRKGVGLYYIGPAPVRFRLRKGAVVWAERTARIDEATAAFWANFSANRFGNQSGGPVPETGST